MMLTCQKCGGKVYINDEAREIPYVEHGCGAKVLNELHWDLVNGEYVRKQ